MLHLVVPRDAVHVIGRLQIGSWRINIRKRNPNAEKYIDVDNEIIAHIEIRIYIILYIITYIIIALCMQRYNISIFWIMAIN